MIQIHSKYGYIRGGACHQRIKDRHGRAEGSRMAWNDIVDNPKFVKKVGPWYRLLKVPFGRKPGQYGGGYIEIGYLRMLQSVFPSLVKNKTKFRLKWMNNWIEGVASAEFGFAMETPLSIITPGEKVGMGLAPPKAGDDVIYEKKYGVKSGLVKQK